MLVLGIESSCDETAASVVGYQRVVLSNVVASQIAIHKLFGGVVPELASRHHMVSITTVVRAAIAHAFGIPDSHWMLSGTSKVRSESEHCEITKKQEQSIARSTDILALFDGIAVTCGPGLVGSLMVGLQVAKGLSVATGVPLTGVNHLEAHLEAVYAVEGDAVGRVDGWDCVKDTSGGPELPPPPATPHVALVVSGGHTVLLLVERRGAYRMLGSTRDDAAGEAFDKVAKMLGLGYPGGVTINRLARGGDPAAIQFPRALPTRGELDFSFSGLKTAVRLYLQRNGPPANARSMQDFCASVQEAIVDVLVRKARAAVRLSSVSHLVVAGGVAANTRLTEAVRAAAERDGFAVHIPHAHLCTDNAAMVAVAGARRVAEGQMNSLELDATARWMPSTKESTAWSSD